jgi:hypothetical protein
MLERVLININISTFREPDGRSMVRLELFSKGENLDY